VPNLARD